MVSYDNAGRKIGEINAIIRPGEGVVTTKTIYSGERIIQNISTRDRAGNVKPETVYDGKILP